MSVHKHAKKLGQYPVILTSHLVNNPYIFYQCSDDFQHLSKNMKVKLNILRWKIPVRELELLLVTIMIISYMMTTYNDDDYDNDDDEINS